MSDFFDRLREYDELRVGWARAARRFERNVWRIHDAKYREHLERRWEQELTKPLAKLAEAEELVEEAVNAWASDTPLSYEEFTREPEYEERQWYEDSREWAQEDQHRVNEYIEEIEEESREPATSRVP